MNTKSRGGFWLRLNLVSLQSQVTDVACKNAGSTNAYKGEEDGNSQPFFYRLCGPFWKVS